jgi:predicted nucleic acid-binding protein
MGSEQKLVLIDTNVFVIDLRYQRDPFYSENRRFLENVAKSDTGFTTLINLLELCGILSFNLNEAQLRNLWAHFSRKYRVSVLPTPDFEAHCPIVEQKRVLHHIGSRSSFSDALMIATVENYLPFVSTMITWDKEHLQGVFPGAVLTPRDYLFQG